MRTISIIGSLALPLLLGSVAASAHAFLDRADPQVGSTVHTPPREVSLSFSQKLEPAFSSISVTDASGQRVDVGKPRISGTVMRVSLRAARPGTYRVIWRVLSADTHTTEGAFSFHVGE